MASYEAYFRELVDGRRRSLADRLLLFILRLCSFPYAAVMLLRAHFYSLGIFKSRQLPKPVISVGNLVVGGTGKTPMTAWIARYLMKKGKKVTVLTRGYGGALEGSVAVVSDGVERLLDPVDAGDEPCLLAGLLPGVAVVMGSDRYEAGRLALEKFQPDIFILDDGFQHMKLKRQLDIILLDAANPRGNSWTFPAGLLREPFSAIRRGDLAVFTRSKGPGQGGTSLPTELAVCHSRHRLTGFCPLTGGDARPFSQLKGLRGLAFAGIADPSGFFDSLEAEGLTLAATLSFPDHTAYGDDEVAALARLKKSCNAGYLITTAKDAVKFGAPAAGDIPFYVASLEISFYDDAPLRSALDKLL